MAGNHSMELRPGVTERDAIAYTNEYQRRHELPEIPRPTWYEFIRPLAETDKAAWQDSGATWLYDVRFVQEVAEYLAKRRVLIQTGRWSQRRPYSLGDMRNLVDEGVLDGEIEHPVFAPANAE
jgi:hypothetical protein